MKYVVDASFVVKSILKSDTTVENRLRDLLQQPKNKKIELISSKLLNIEIANALRFSIKDPKQSVSVFNDFMRLPLKTYILTKSQLKETISKSYELGTTVYDTSYHILAKAFNAKFLTCDEKYYIKAKILGDIELIK